MSPALNPNRIYKEQLPCSKSTAHTDARHQCLSDIQFRGIHCKFIAIVESLFPAYVSTYTSETSKCVKRETLDFDIGGNLKTHSLIAHSVPTFALLLVFVSFSSSFHVRRFSRSFPSSPSWLPLARPFLTQLDSSCQSSFVGQDCSLHHI